jgi:ABC-type antimicrobial peptide transport system permease subunit
MEDQHVTTEGLFPSQFVVSVADNYFQTMGVELRAGRFFDSADDQDSLPVVIIDERFAEALLKDSLVADSSSLLGKRIQVDPQRSSEWLTIIGVSSHIVQGQTAGSDEGITTLYRPFYQRAERLLNFVLPMAEDGAAQLQAIRVAAARVDRNVPVIDAATFEERAISNMSGLNLIGSFFVIISMATLVLSGSGIYAIISRSVLQRTQETGIRRALGCSDLSTVMLFLRKGLVYFAAAIVCGGLLAALTSQGLSSIFPTIVGMLPPVFAAVVLGFSIVIFGSSYLPARKIIRLDPGDALRYE